MKYVSPKTEQRKQAKRKRRKRIMLCVALLCLVGVVAGIIFAVSGKNPSNDNPQTDSGTITVTPAPTDEGSPEDTTAEDATEDTTTEDSATEESVGDKDSGKDTQDKPQKKPKKKQSLVAKVKAIFSKTEPIPVTYSAISFGKTIDTQMDEIVSLSPLATEIILSSPSQQALVAVSRYCNKQGNDKLMTVGTPLLPDVDKIIQLKPDCVIVQTPLSDIDKKKIEQNGITVLQLDYPQRVEDLGEIYRSVTALTMGGDIATFESQRIMADITEKLSLYTRALENQNKLNAVMVFNSYGMVSTADTMEGKLLSYFFDVKDFGSDYTAENMEAVVATNPQVLIVSDKMSEENLAQLGLADTDAVANGRVYYVDTQQFEVLSLKAIKTLCGIANEVYGDIIQPPATETEG